ncbi:DUF5906 domain-containing protein [Solimicrobium silvestre]|uniref:NrS-1 polymerase-like helicase domain-containing protein n=1 Tax=Solimicrobium silvestre TaxID=2099400 RepID=A0A2S9GZB4_9BURK|nr:DUF5906 domain-containing protein [Solimicrobium silvestre]PRC93075.1 hypothetical protein S2091_2161 [Solimicrobium silvestre]
MSRDDFQHVKQAALYSIEALLTRWLPNGVLEGREWCIGSREGEAGRSMKVCIAGERIGRWSDFASGDTGGDLISLYSYINSISQLVAMKEVAGQLGIDIASARIKSAITPIKTSVSAIPELIKNKRTAWVPILPVPDDAPVAPVAHLVRGRSEISWAYRNQQGYLLGMVHRFKTSKVGKDGKPGKEFYPCVYARHPNTGASEWRWMGFPDPRPLYLTAPLRDDALVLIPEGEKCADAGFKAFPQLDVVSWGGGSNAVAKHDWTPLAGRNVIVWSDADAAGAKATLKLIAILFAIGCTVKIVLIPDGVEEGWDIVNAIEDGRDVRAMLSAAVLVTASDLTALGETGSPPSPTGEEQRLGDESPKDEHQKNHTTRKLSLVVSNKPDIPAPDAVQPGEGKAKRKLVERGESFWDGVNHLLEHFTLLYGTNTAWDDVERIQILIPNLRYAFGADQVKFWLNNRDRKMINSRCLVFDPTETVDLETHVNMFNGFNLEPQAGECGLILDLLAHLCGDQQELIDWVIKWIAYPLQHPGAKMSTSIIMHGDEGSGKNLFWETVVRNLYGEYGGVIGNAQLEAQFNEWASKKLFFVADEVVTRNELRQMKGKLKSLISGDEININPKNLPERREANHINFVFLSNELQPLALDKTDRRYLVVWTPPKHEAEYYKAIADQVGSGGLEAFYHYLLQVDCSDFNAHTKPIDTVAKRNLISLGLTSPERFYREWEAGVLPLPFISCSAMQLFAAFLRWSNLNNERFPPTQTEFGGKVERMAAGAVKRKAVKYDLRNVVKQRIVYLVGTPPEGKKLNEWVGDASDLFETYLKKYRHVYDQSEQT